MSIVFDEEKKYLDTVNQIIHEQINDMTIRHKAISKEKLSGEDRKRGQHLNNNKIMDFLYTNIKKMKIAIPSPYFGRMNFVCGFNNKMEKYYIGKATIMGNDNKLYVIDWRAPIAGLYYDSSLGKAEYIAPSGTISGEITLKRQLIIEDSSLKKIIDVDLVGRDALLQEYLDVHANDKMKNIVASIQKEQNQVIRYDKSKNIIVQGIAGSGKTSVALHRIAYLMYLLNSNTNFPSIVNSNQFVVIGPNSYFLDYISSVLPDLDVNQANQLTLTSLVSKIIKEKVTINDQSYELQEYFKRGIKNNYLIKENTIDFEKAINKYVNELYNYYSSKDITYLDNIIFNKNYIVSCFLGNNNKLGDTASNLTKQLINRIKDDYKSDFGKFDNLLTGTISSKIKALPQDSEQRKLLYEKIDLIHAALKTGLAKTIKEYFSVANKTIFQHYVNFISNLEKYTNIEGIENYKDSTLKRLSKKTLSRSDIAPIMFLKEKLSITPEFRDVIQIIIDEAQDLSLLEFKSLKKLFPNATFSIFGDLNQAIFSYHSVKNWELVSSQVFDGNCDFFKLNQSYRTTDEIMKEANKVSLHLTKSVSEDVVRHGESVDYLRYQKEEIALIVKSIVLENLEKGNKSIAIITKTEDEALQINSQLEKIGMGLHNISSSETKYTGGVCTIASSLVKGLEFDASILVNVNNDNYDVDNDIDMKLLYIAMTRALHKTSIIYSNELPSVLNMDTDKKLIR